jgi:hypothetical protein
VLAASAASAGDWNISWTFTSGYPGISRHPVYRPWYPIYHPRYPVYQPWHPVHPVRGPSGWIVVNDGGWSVGGWGGYPSGGGWRPVPGTYYVQPWTGSTVTIITGGAYASAADAPPTAPRPAGGVFMVPVSAPPKASDARLDGIRAPLPSPTVTEPAEDATPAPPTRRSIEAASRVYRTGGVARAEEELGKLLRANPSDAEISCDYAYVLFLREKYATAGYCLRRAMVLDAKVVESGAAGISSFHDAKASAAALERLDQYLETQPKDASARLVRAWALFLDGKADDARAEIDRVLEISPDDAQARALREFVKPPEPAAPAEPATN